MKFKPLAAVVMLGALSSISQIAIAASLNVKILNEVASQSFTIADISDHTLVSHVGTQLEAGAAPTEFSTEFKNSNKFHKEFYVDLAVSGSQYFQCNVYATLHTWSHIDVPYNFDSFNGNNQYSCHFDYTSDDNTLTIRIKDGGVKNTTVPLTINNNTNHDMRFEIPLSHGLHLLAPHSFVIPAHQHKVIDTEGVRNMITEYHFAADEVEDDEGETAAIDISMMNKDGHEFLFTQHMLALSTKDHRLIPSSFDFSMISTIESHFEKHDDGSLVLQINHEASPAYMITSTPKRIHGKPTFGRGLWHHPKLEDDA